MLKGKTIGFIGAGKMAEALVRGLIASGKVSPAQIIANDIDKSRCLHMAEAFKVKVFSEKAEVVQAADIVFVAVKPQQMEEALGEVAPDMAPEKLVISIAAGVTTEGVAGFLKSGGAGDDIPVVRAMPNTPAIVGEGITGIVAGRCAGRAELDLAVELFGAVGSVVLLDDETHIDAVTALSGSGPAFVFYFMEALVDGGVKAGLEYEKARELALQTTLGAARLAMESKDDLRKLRKNVTSPGGTTVEGIKKLEEGQFYDNIVDALRAASRRAKELSGR